LFPYALSQVPTMASKMSFMLREVMIAAIVPATPVSQRGAMSYLQHPGLSLRHKSFHSCIERSRTLCLWRR
jgi:hypothetical protein